jgi:prolyl-tRNA synthetase
MRLSHLFVKTSKDKASDADSINADLLTRGGFIHKTMAGAYSYLPLGLRVIRKIESIIREEMNAGGGQEILMSALSPRENWEQTGRWDPKSFDVLFHVPGAGDHEYALNPTHEEIVTPLAKQFVKSYKDLPFACYQIQTKFRNELRAKSGVLRGREFIMKDLYSFHTDQSSLDTYYDRMQQAYDNVWERAGLGERTYLTYASGGSFSKYSHEYQVVLANGEDTIYVSEEAEKKGKRVAINKEIYVAGETTCPVTGGTAFREERASEAGNIFMLGTRFSEPFKLNYTNEKGELHPIVMGCYGIGVSRLMGILAEAFGDDAGLRWPASVAPAQVHIVAIAKTKDEDAYIKAEQTYDKLTKEGIDCLFDDRLDASVGSRLADADLIGVPTRVIFSHKTLANGSVEVKNRMTGEVVMHPLQDALKLLGRQAY